MMLTGRLCHRYGNHQVTVVCAVLLSLSISLPPLTHSPLTLGLVLLIFGVAYGGINNPRTQRLRLPAQVPRYTGACYSWRFPQLSAHQAQPKQAPAKKLLSFRA